MCKVQYMNEGVQPAHAADLDAYPVALSSFPMTPYIYPASYPPTQATESRGKQIQLPGLGLMVLR